jgi:DNA-binding transcriptional ArsR family regulator
MKSTDAVRALAALAQESRLAVFRLLVKRAPEGYTPSVIAEKLGVAATTLSFHL